MTSRRHVIQDVSRRLEALGYRRVPGPIDGAAVVSYKAVDDLILTLGVQFSTRYADRFTGSFYLSRSLEWAYLPHGFPANAYQRVGRFLSVEERARLLQPFFSQRGVVDAWWEGTEAPVLSAFWEAIKLTEPRFLGQPGVITTVRECEALALHRVILEEVARTGRDLVVAPQDLNHQPSSHYKGAGPRWYWAAEIVLRRYKPDAVNPAFVGLVALDAWRVETLIRGADRLRETAEH
jgi:hypothetical protein